MWMKNDHPFAVETKRLELMQRLNAIEGITIPDDAISRRPSFPLSVLTNPTALSQFIDVLNWYVTEVMS